MLLSACSGGQNDVENVETIAEPLGSSVSSAESSAAPSSTGVDATSKFPGGAKACTQIGCRDQFVIHTPNVKLAAGTYSITVDADGKTSTCPLVVDAKGAKTDGCQGDAGVMLALPGSVPVAGAEGGFSLVFDKAPASIKVGVSIGKKKIADQGFTPVYRTFQPNGPDCKPTCKQGQETFTLK